MKRKWICILSIALLLCSTGLFCTTASASVKAGRKGMTLDSARTFYSPDLIKKYIRTLSKHHASFLNLHLTDNERFGVENAYLGQTTRKAVKKHGIYYNKKTKKAFLSKNQLKELIRYAKQRHIELIPEIDLPGHDESVLRLLSYSKKGRHIKRQVVQKGGYHEMKYGSVHTLTLSKRILSEYFPLLSKGMHIGIGTDELSVDTKSQEKAFAKYLNAMDSYVNKHGKKLSAWNDGFHKRVISKIHKNILVFYWSRNGEISNEHDRREMIRLRATLPQLVKKGFNVINCDFYYLYVINNKKMYTADSRSYWKQALKKWNSHVWDDNNFSDAYHGKKKIGAAICIWGVADSGYNGQRSYKLSQQYLNAFLQHK